MESDAGKAMAYALRELARRDHTVAQISKKLSGRWDGETAGRIVARLRESGYLNDARFAERFAEHAVSTGRFYGVRLRQEMRRRGLSPEIIAPVLEKISGERDEREEIDRCLDHRFPGFAFRTADDREKRKVVAYLQRKGFPLSAVLQTLRGNG
jgi:regulatory protein